MTFPPTHLAHTALTRLACAVALAGLSACAELSHMQGWTRIQAGDYARGLQDLQSAAERAKTNLAFRRDWLVKREEVTNLLMTRAKQAIDSNHVDKAREIYLTILAYDPDNVRAKAALDGLQSLDEANRTADAANQALLDKEFKRARDLANQVLSIMPNQATAKQVIRALDEQAARDLLATPTLSNLYQKPISLEFREASLKMIFDVLSKSTGINFVLDREVKTDQRTSIFLKQASLEDAIDMLAATNQLDKKILNPTSVLIYPNTPSKTKEYQDLVVRAFYLNSANAKATAELIKAILKLKDLYVDDKLNMLVVRDTADAIALTERLVTIYDIPDPEVMLEVEVLEIDRNLALNLGIQITDQLTVTPLNATTTTTGTTTTSSMTLQNLLHLNKNNFGVTTPSVTISADQQDGDSDLLANPRIRVRNHDKARILIGDKIPVISTTTSNTGFVAENIQYEEVGMKLNVEPTIFPKDEVAIKVNLEVSSLGQQVQTKTGTVAYQIGTRTAETTLRLKDGETQILAGLINHQERASAKGLAGLSGLPIIGSLFGNRTSSRNKSEIVLSITPHLIRGIPRQGPGAEMFWSGTDAVLRNKPLQLRIQPEGAAAPVPGTQPNATATPPASVPGEMAPQIVDSPLRLNWQGPATLKVGEQAEYQLQLNSTAGLRGLPSQLAFDPQKVEIVSIREGGFFSRDGNQANFSYTIDPASGRIAIAAGGNQEATPGQGALLVVKVKAVVPGASSLSLESVTPVGSSQSIQRPALPVKVSMTCTPS
ncbi:general secretion pathway protein GspD [Burkholderiaceae bacterium DAT-1]|nr:general secretion pathway protein GspD [Burkholderiaceae bacterium DAT-1]